MDLSSALGILTNSLNGTNTATEKRDLSLTGSAKKKVKKVVDPDAPKKPTTSYFSFAAEERGRVREERESERLPPLSNAEMTLAIAGRWNALDDKGKEPWSKLYKTQMAQYQEELNTYLAKKGQNDDLTATKTATPSKTSTKASIKTPTKTPTKSKPVAKSVVKAVLNPEVSSSDSSSSSSSSSSENDSTDSSNNSSDSSDDSDESSEDEIDQSLLHNTKVKAMVDVVTSKRSRKEEVAVPSKEKTTVKDQKRKKSKTVE